MADDKPPVGSAYITRCDETVFRAQNVHDVYVKCEKHKQQICLIASHVPIPLTPVVAKQLAEWLLKAAEDIL